MPDEMNEPPQQVDAEKQAEEVVEDVKEEVDRRDSAILEELRHIHEAINAQTEHHIRHLEAHTTAPSAPTQEIAQDATNDALPEDKAVSLEIEEPKDMVKEESKRRRRKFGKR